MEILFCFFILNNIVMSVWVYKSEKNNAKWLNDAQKAYSESLNTLFYPKSEIALRKKYNFYASVELRNLIGSWLIIFIVPIIFNLKICIIVYLINYLFGRILYLFSVLETKIDIINEHIFNEDEYL